MDLNEVMKQSALAITSRASNVVIMPKYIKAGYFSKMGPVAYGVLSALYEYINTTTGECYPRQDKIADYMGISRRATVTEALNTLEYLGIIRRIPARVLNGKGKLDVTANQIIIIPFDKIEDKAYLKAIDDYVERVKYIVVKYNEDGSRKIISDGEKTKSHTQKKVNEMIKTTISTRKIDTQIQAIDEAMDDVEFLIKDLTEEGLLECDDTADLEWKLKDIVRRAGEFSIDIYEKMDDYQNIHGSFTSQALLDIVQSVSFKEAK